MQSQTASPRRLLVFLCHSSADKPMIRVLYEELKECDVQPWLDEKDIIPGQDWDRAIQRAVGNCDVFIACLTPDFIRKEGYGQKEIKLALDTELQKPESANYLIPLKLHECELPERLRRFHAINYYEEDGFVQLIGALQYRIEHKNASLAGISPINDEAARRLAATHPHSQTTSPSAPPPISAAPTPQGHTPQHGGSRGGRVRLVANAIGAIALALIVIIAALVGSQFFKLSHDAPSPTVTSTPTPAQSGATITFDALGSGSTIIEVYPGVGNTAQDKAYNGTYPSGEKVQIVCETKGRTVTSDPAAGEQYRQSAEWYKLQTPPGSQPQYATAVYADEHGSVPQC